MKKAIIAAGLATFMLLTTGAGTALAGGPGPAAHFRFSFSVENLSPAGTVCNFTLDDEATVGVNFAAAPSGTNVTLLTENVTHTNLDTGYSLTEVDQVNTVVVPASLTVVQVGIFWHLVNSSGQVVLVDAGEATLDITTGQLISFTPNSGFDQTYAQIICPALGGSPA